MVMIMAAGGHLSFGNENLEIEPLDQLPSKRCLLDIQLSRCNTIAELLSVRLEIVVVCTPFKDRLHKYLNKCRYHHLIIHEIDQFEMGLIDEEGRLLMQSAGCLYRLPNGTGDVLARLVEERLL